MKLEKKYFLKVPSYPGESVLGAAKEDGLKTAEGRGIWGSICKLLQMEKYQCRRRGGGGDQALEERRSQSPRVPSIQSHTPPLS